MRDRPEELVLYSPAPPTISLHAHNEALGEALRACDVAADIKVVAMALPDSINAINQLDSTVKPYHLPIITTLDFQPAIRGGAPTWHAYEPVNPDLKFVAALYEVTFGVLVFDSDIRTPADLAGRRIAVPPQPSSVRWFSEALLRDGWNVLDQVTLVEMRPPDIPAALARGEIDATTWNIMSETPDGYIPLLPMLLEAEGAHWLDMDQRTEAAINAANPFIVEQVPVSPDRLIGVQSTAGAPASLLSFRQGLAAWASTPDQLVSEILTCMSSANLPFGTGSSFDEEQLRWPGLNDADVHTAARHRH